MTLDLLLLRAGKAAKPDGVADADRPLKDRGKRAVQRIGAWLAGQDLVPAVVVTAPTERARTSGQKALKAAGIGVAGLRSDPRLDGADPAGPLAVLDELRGVRGPVLLVMSGKAVRGLAGQLLAQPVDRPVPPGTLLHLALDESNLRPGSARLAAVIRPADLPKRFPFPGPDGPEWRDRPAYYYRQSAVIPYRTGAHGLEILVITSSRRNHWVVPKGIHDPGLSARDSAAREAEEEAGALGRVHEAPVGVFDLEKWGATCRVFVYPMEVTEVVDHATWDESHRSRLWVTPAQAVERLGNDGLKKIVADFAASMG